jgi:hypothetical protein
MTRRLLRAALVTALIASPQAVFASNKGHGGGPKAGKAMVSAPKSPKATKAPKAAPAPKAGKAPKAAKAPKATPTTTGAPLTPVQQKLQKNAKLQAKLAARLPAGTDVMAASKGFKNLGQFVAAVNASHNTGIPFADLKTRMVTDGMSLGQAVKDVTNPGGSDGRE